MRQAVTAASTIIVAMLLAFSVPVSQLRTVSVQSECCCPEPDHCTCPDHQADGTPQPSMRVCHKKTIELVSPVLPAFVPPVAALALALHPATVDALFALPAPHATPILRRPDAPS